MAAELDRLNASVAALKVSVDKVLPLVGAGIDPALLTPVADAIDALKADVEAKLPASE